MGDHVRIRDMVQGTDFWLALDAGGGLWRLDGPTLKPSRMVDCHAGAVTAVGASPTTHVAASAGADGTVRVFDYLNKSQLVSGRYSAPASALIFLPVVRYACGR